METLRFLMITSHYPPEHLGGDAVFVENLSSELAKRGHEVHVLHDPAVYSLVRGKPTSTVQHQGIVGVTVHTPSSKGTSFKVVMRLAFGEPEKVRDEVRKLTSSLGIDVVHWHNTKGFVGRPFKAPPARTLYTAHDYYLVCPRSNLTKPGMRPCERPFLCQTCLLRWRKPPQLWRTGPRRVLRPSPGIKVLSPSEFMARRLQEDGVQTDHVLRTFVHDVAPVSRIGGPTLAFIGLVEPFKGVRTLVEAFYRSMGSHSFKLAIIGEGSLRDELQSRVAQLGISDRVSVPGFLPTAEVQAILGNATAMIVPSEWPENAPLSVLESFSMGVPIVSSDQGGLPEIVTPDSGSVTFRAGAVDDLASRIISLWERRNEMEGARAAARRAYEANFSPSVHLRQYLGIVNEPDRS